MLAYLLAVRSDSTRIIHDALIIIIFESINFICLFYNRYDLRLAVCESARGTKTCKKINTDATQRYETASTKTRFNFKNQQHDY